jgi:integrase
MAMAWAEKLPSGRYRGVYRDAAGKRRSVGRTFSHKAEAEREAATKETKARRSMYGDPDAQRRSWGEWVEDWWPTRSVEPSTLRVDEGRRKKHLDPHWSGVPLGAIRRHDISAWAAKMRREGVSAAMVQRSVHLLSASLSAAVDAEILDANPAARLKLPKGPLAQERFLTREEYGAIQDELPTTRDQLIMHLLTYTGLRWGEMAGLHWDRVDLARGQIEVVETFDERAGDIKAYPKGKLQRPVPLLGWLADMLDELPREWKTCGLVHRAGRCRSGLVLTTENGRVLRNSNWAPVWRDAVERAGVGHVRIHDCRHTYASWLIQAGIPVAKVGQLMGHKSPSTTQKYAHLGEIDAGDIFDALGDR